MGDIVKSIQERMSGAAPGLDISSGFTNQIVADQEKKKAIIQDNAKAERDTINDIRKKQAEKQILMGQPETELFNSFISQIGKDAGMDTSALPTFTPGAIDQRSLAATGKILSTLESTAASRRMNSERVGASLELGRMKNLIDKGKSGKDIVDSWRNTLKVLDDKIADMTKNTPWQINDPARPESQEYQRITEQANQYRNLIAKSDGIKLEERTNQEMKQAPNFLESLANYFTGTNQNPPQVAPAAPVNPFDNLDQQ